MHVLLICFYARLTPLLDMFIALLSDISMEI